jgi:hypothetical protein
MSRSNCVIFAFLLLRRRWWNCNPKRSQWRKAENGGLFWRKSHSGPFFHVLYQETRRGRVRQISYKPVAPVRRWVPPPLFIGRVRWGDGH